ncbi:MAG: tandem-95 repeat protein, partial [Pseudomonadota bacterium]
SIDEDTTGNFTTGNLLANDSDPEGDTLTVTSIGTASNGVVTMLGTQITYQPNPDFFGQDTFTYTVSDGNGGETTRTATINVTAVNDLPVVDLNSLDGGSVDFATSYTENAPAIAIVDGSLSISDVDDTLLEDATITLTNGQIGDLLDIGTLPATVSAVVTPPGALTSAQAVTITLTGPASASDFILALQAITYRSTSEALADGQRRIEIQVNDGDGLSPLAQTTITTIAQNDDPVAVDDNATVLEDGSVDLTVAQLLSNDTDADLEPLTIVSVGAPSVGTVSQAGNVFTFTPPADYFGPASFIYTIEDGAGAQRTATVNIDVTAVNDRPVVTVEGAIPGSPSQAAYTENDLPVTIFGGLISISDVDDSQLDDLTVTLSNAFVGDQISAGTLPPGITATITPAGPISADGIIQVVLTGPADHADFVAALQALQFSSTSDNINEAIRLLVVQADDGTDTSLTAGGRVLVTAVNDAPVPVADPGLVTLEDEPLVLLPSALLSNDTDAEGDTLSISAVGTATNGTVELLVDGSIRFTPLADYFGPATFTYTVSDGQGGATDVTANVVVQSVDDAPEIDLDSTQGGTVDFATTYVENAAPVPITSADVAVIDPDSPMLASATIVLTNANVGDILHVGTLPAGMSFTTSETFPIAAVGSVILTINGPASAADFQQAIEAVSYSSASENPSEAQRTLVFRINDGTSDSAIAISRIAVQGVNDQPTSAGVAPFAAVEDTQLVIEFADLLATVSDPEDDPVTVLNVGPATNGTVTLSGGQVFFQPDPEFSGTASFDYDVTDGLSAPVTLSATVEVASVNDAPLIDLNGVGAGTDLSATYAEQAPTLPLVTSDISIVDVDDPDLSSVTVTLTNGEVGDHIEVGVLPASITIAGGAPAALTVAGPLDVVLQGPASQADFMLALQALGFSNNLDNLVEGTRVISFTVSDGAAVSNVATTSIAVTAVNDAPVAADDGVPLAIAGIEDVPLVVQPLANDIDPDGDLIVISSIDGLGITPGSSVDIANANIALATDGVTVTVTPAANYAGPISFTYRVTDGALGDDATVYIDFAPVNDAPVAVDDGPLGFDEDTSITFDPIAGSMGGIGIDGDVDGDALSIVTLASQPIIPGGFVDIAEGRLSLAADGRTVTFVPNQDINGSIPVGYGVTDGTAVSEATITFDVAPVNDATIVSGQITDTSFLDGEIVNLPVGNFFFDVDGDALSFTANGLPAGLSINSSNGIISGQIASDASQSGPYTVTISATDGLSPVATQTFEITVANVAPIVVPASDITLREGDAFAISTATLFDDADGDVLSIAVNGLPAWATYDPAAQMISGTVPFDAAGSGPITLNVDADDQQGGTASTTLTLMPVNPAPVAVTPLPDFQVAEEDSFELNVIPLFADGGNDDDALAISVTGLPDGLEYDAATGIISGAFETGTGSIAPYTVMITVDDGQGGVLLESFDIRVTNDTFLETEDDDDIDSIVKGDVRFDQLVDFGSTAPPLADLTLGNALSDVASLQSISSVSAYGDLTVGNAIDGLAAPSLSTQIAEQDQRSGSLSAGGMPQGVPLSDDPRLDRVVANVVYRDGAVFIAIKPSFDEALDGRVESISVRPAGDGEWPVWLKQVRVDFLTARPPQGATSIDLDVRVKMASGEVLVKTVTVKLIDGPDRPLEDATLRLSSLDR